MNNRLNEGEAVRLTRPRSRRRDLTLDLNTPPAESRSQSGASDLPMAQGAQPGEAAHAMATAPVFDLEAPDDDVVISSPRAFAEAKNNSRRNRGRAAVVDLELDDRSQRSKRARAADALSINSGSCVNLEGGAGNPEGNDNVVPQPPKEPTFCCPICLGPLVEEVSTKCGHIFCKACLKDAIATQNKCPTCRKKTTTRDFIRIYLPVTKNV